MATATAPAPVAGRSRKGPRASTRRRRQAIAAWTLAVPFVALFLVFMAGPVLGSLAMSFTDIKSRDIKNPLGVNPVGVDNYLRLLSDETFQQAARNTAYFVLVGVPLTMVVALAAAIGLNSVKRLRSFFRGGYYLPVVTSIVAVAVVWRFLLQPDSGVFNSMLRWVGINGPDWLNSPAWAMPSLIAMATWRNLGSLMIIFLAGLQTVPAQLLEAADVDGAGRWTKFRYIVLPLLRPTMLFAAVITSVGYVQFFEEPFVMTQGGPLDRTLSLSYYTYNQFGFGNYGYASAVSYVLFVVIVILTIIQFRLLRPKS